MDGGMLAGRAQDGVTIWTTRDPYEGSAIGDSLPWPSVTSIAYSPNGSILAARSSTSGIRLFATLDGLLIDVLDGDLGINHQLQFSPDGRLLASRAWNFPERQATVSLWDWKAATLADVFEARDPSGGLADFSPDGSILATTDSCGLKLWRVSDGSLLRELEDPCVVEAVAFAADQSYLAIAGSGRVVVWGIWP
jgi:WD40 repeat protein